MNENSEKELLKQDLNNQENPEEIKKFIEDVEVMGENEDIVEMAKQKLEEILAKANTVEKTSESQISQVESMGGSTGEIEKRTEGIDKQIEDVKTNATEEIEKVKNENSEEEKKETVAPITEKDAEIKNVETQTEEKTGEVKNENPAETFNSTEMIKEMTGGSEKLERFGRGYDNAINMYASSLTNPTDLEKYKDIFSQLAPEDRAKTEKGIIGSKIKDTMLNWGIPEVEAKFSEDIKNYSEMFPKSVESAKMYATMSTPNFNPTKFQEMYNISGSQLREMLQNTKDKMIEDVKKEENIDTKNLLQYYQERIDNTKDSSEKSKFQRTLQDKMNEIMNVTTKNKIAKINEDYQKRVEQVNK